VGNPTLEFNGTIGQKSIGLGGPDQIEADLLDISKMFNPAATLKSGQAGGLTEANHQTGAHDDRYYTKTLSDAKYALFTQLQDLVLGQIPDGSLTEEKLAFFPGNEFIEAAGTGTAITVSAPQFILSAGLSFTFIAAASNAAAATTLDVNGLGAKSLYKPNTTDAPNIISGKAYTVWYDSGDDCFFVKASAEGDAAVGNVLAGKTFSNDADIGITGTMSNRAGDTAALSEEVSGTTVKLLASDGYRDGSDDKVTSTKLMTAIAGGDTEVSMAIFSTMRTSNNTSYEKIKQATIRFKGTYRCKFSLVSAGAATAYAMIYKNGVAFGMERSAAAGGANFSEDLAFDRGDTMEVWIKTSDAGQQATLSSCGIDIDNYFITVDLN